MTSAALWLSQARGSAALC